MLAMSRWGVLAIVLCAGCGADGKDGTGMSLDSIRNGTGFFSPLNNGLGFDLKHDIYVFSDGSAMVSCEVVGGSDQVSGFRFFKATQVGAHDFGCQLTWDLNDNSGGWCEFKLGSVTYRDSNSSYNGRVTPLTYEVH